MGENSAIAWCKHSYSEWRVCTEDGPECTDCYAKDQMKRWQPKAERAAGKKFWGKDVPRIRTSEGYRNQPWRWNEEARKAGEVHTVFANHLSDVGDDHPSIDDQWRREFAQMVSYTPNLRWLILSKRPENLPELLMDLDATEAVRIQCKAAGVPFFMKQDSGPRPGMRGRIPDHLWVHEFPATARPVMT